MNHLHSAPPIGRPRHLLVASVACSIIACAPRPAPHRPTHLASPPPRAPRPAPPPRDSGVSVSYGELVRQLPPANTAHSPPPQAEDRQAAIDALHVQEDSGAPPLHPTATGHPAIDLPDESLASQIAGAGTPNAAASLRLVEEGRVLLNQQRYDQALERFERSVSVDPSNFYGYYYLARLYHATKDYSQALAFANRAVALGGRVGHVWLARVYTLQGAIFEEVGRFADARSAYQRAVNTDPENLAASVGRARLSPQPAPVDLPLPR